MGEALRLLRVFHDIKTSELAKYLGITPTYISQYEKGSRQVSLALLRKYERIFKIPLSSIISFSEELSKEKKDKNFDKNIKGKIELFIKILKK